MKQRGHARSEERAGLFFSIYHALGPARSLALLHGNLARLGTRVSLNTLKNYSADYDWQARLAEIEAQEMEEQAVSHVALVKHMNVRQAALGRAMQGVAETAIGQLAEALKAEDAEPMGAQALARLAEIGTKIERLAMGEATTRAEILVSTYSTVVQEFVGLFIVVNDLAEAEERKRQYALGVDAIIDRHLDEANISFAPSDPGSGPARPPTGSARA